MRVIGLTGGIAAGKSLVARRLRERGAAVIDADGVARDVVAPGTRGLREIAAIWPEVVGPTGLDRRRLGAIVFADADARRRLEAIVHPRVREEVARQVAALAADGLERVVYEAALIVEHDLDASMDALLLVCAPEEERVRRIVARDGLTEAEARARIAAQLPDDRRRARATFVLENDADEATLGRRTDAAWDAVLQRF